MLTTPKNKGELFLASSLCDGLEDTNIKQVTTLILNKEADPNVLIPTHGITPFHLVIGNDSEIFAEEVTKLFLRHGGNPNVKSVDGLTPVHVAAAWGRIRILELLLANGGDPLLLDDEGRSPFHYAFDGKYYKIITLLGNYCGYSVGEDDKPKYKMSLDKIVLNNGNTIAEYIIPKNVSPNKNYNNNSSKMILRYCNEETSSGICDSYMISTISSLASKQDLKESDLKIKFEKLNINENVKKEKFLISEIINSLSSTLTSDSTVSEATFAHVKHEKRNIPKKSCILPLLSSSQKTSSNLNSIKPKKKYFSSKFKQKNILDNSIITTSPNFYTPINTKKKQNIIKTSNVKSCSPLNNLKNKHAKSIVTPCSSKYYKSPAPNEYNQQKKEMIQSTPRRKQRREQISYKDIKKYIGNRNIKNNFALEDSNETYNRFSSNTSTLSLSPDDSCYPESRNNETYVDKRLAVKLHESKYDENIILSYDDTSPNLTESDDPAISLTNLENINNINNNNKHEHNNDLYEICSEEQSLVKLTKLKKTMTSHCVPKIDKYMKITVNVDEENLLNNTEISDLQNNQVDASNASERNVSVSRSSISYVSVQEEYKYEDREEGVILVERRKCITPASIQEDSEKNESSFSQNKTNPSRRWREGTAKTSFNYLLLDPRVTQDLPHRALQLTQSEVWMTFLSSIFYVGKGKRSRPYAHLYDAFNMWVSKEQYLLNTKIKHILDIWNDGYGVICLHVFQNTIPVEAYTREAIMIDTLGIEHLTNCKSGEYYGIISTWSQRDKCRFGRYLLYKALQILLHEGERQLFPENL
ncbi:PREDICTED: ankyrin-3-like isoform X2 [Polistes canadensis]|uniref:ankyrin-3-like isoform X2 n=1 Tax=Polistes canadensis TaxID=91411 RepID=UPI000718F02C|nr:PREDICTED: ankyrin-3-like isoform X2 [Polistes canadensis]